MYVVFNIVKSIFYFIFYYQMNHYTWAHCAKNDCAGGDIIYGLKIWKVSGVWSEKLHEVVALYFLLKLVQIFFYLKNMYNPI